MAMVEMAMVANALLILGRISSAHKMIGIPAEPEPPVISFRAIHGPASSAFQPTRGPLMPGQASSFEHAPVVGLGLALAVGQ